MEIILLVLGGLGLFLFAVNMLSTTLNDLLGDKARHVIRKYVSNILSSILTGLIVTIILDSSSAVIILTIVLVNARVLTFHHAMGIVMGANIGTTFSSQLIALDIGKYSPIAIVAGVIMSLFSRSDRLSKTARALIYFGILFFGLYTMERSVEPLRDDGTFIQWMHRLNNPLKGAGAGALVTLIIQSSSATVGIVITLAKKGLIELPGALAVMLGAELGTCSDTLIATIRSNRQAIKTGLFHLGFNLVSIILGLIFFQPFVHFIYFLSGRASLAQQVATGHIMFNVLGVILFLPFVKLIARLLDWMVPDKPEASMRSPVTG
ncbi:Na/Pi cotransporter family protein [Polluticoccus soli]|uniref:Na/Pi cotransporter family protein n=1 Tax=Polluticoccus soli TaxID=3034150 RepID=UPI0023E0C231|nr:Na/Pi symporter [Flavipsychrobacter sp. JY13-12]